jgi:hypothetical protein
MDACTLRGLPPARKPTKIRKQKMETAKER